MHATREKIRTNPMTTAADIESFLSATSATAQNKFQQTSTLVRGKVEGLTQPASEKVGRAIASTTQHTQSAVEGFTDRVQQWSNGINYAIPTMIVNSLQTWLDEHPFLSWLVTHPLWAIAFLFLLLLLLVGLIKALSKFTEQLWLALFHSPFHLTQWILGILPKAFQRKQIIENKIPQIQPSDKQERLIYILNRLEAIKQEQDELLKEVKSLLMSKESQ